MIAVLAVSCTLLMVLRVLLVITPAVVVAIWALPILAILFASEVCCVNTTKSTSPALVANTCRVGINTLLIAIVQGLTTPALAASVDNCCISLVMPALRRTIPLALNSLVAVAVVDLIISAAVVSVAVALAVAVVDLIISASDVSAVLKLTVAVVDLDCAV